MASISNWLELELLDHVLKTGSYAVPANIYVALGTGADDTGLTGEPGSGNYARKIHNSWNTAASRAATNNGVITFNQANGSWGTISHYALFDAVTGGNFLAWGVLNTSKSIVSGNTPSIADTEISVSFNAGGASNYLANALLDHVLKTTEYTVPTNVCVALCTADPTDAGTGSTITEPSGQNYARKTHNAWDVAAAGATENTGVITFNVPSGSWGLITHVALCDATTVGNMLFHSTATPNQTPDNGDTVQYADGALDITLD
jgi:hypothetical protein